MTPVLRALSSIHELHLSELPIMFKLTHYCLKIFLIILVDDSGLVANSAQLLNIEAANLKRQICPYVDPSRSID